MSKKTLEKNDKGIGLEFKVKKNTARSNRIGFSNNIFAVDETVYIISEAERFDLMKQIDDYESRIAELEEEDKLQKTILQIKDKYGKNMILKGHDFEEGGTTRERNKQIGGHKA